jgi:hypothetical protein
MKNFKVTSTSKSVELGEIQQVEQLIGVKLPEIYKHFLLESNGGTSTRNLFLSEEVGFRIEEFLSLEKFTRTSLANRDDVPEIKEADMEVIAYTLGASVVCIGVGEKNFGKIYYFEVALDPILIASDLTAFFDSLKDTE